MLKAMRRSVQSTFVKIFLFGLLIISFGLWGVTDVFFTSPESRTVAEVDGEKLDFSTYANMYQQMLRRTGLQQTNIELDAQSGQFIEQIVLQNWALGVAIDREVASLRLAVTDAELRDEIRRDPGFRDSEGNFSRTRFTQFLARSGLSEQNYLRSLEADILQNQLISDVFSSTPLPPAQAALLQRYNQTYRSSQMIEILSTPFMDIPPAEQATLEDYYSQNSERFRKPETRSIEIIDLSLDAVAQNLILEADALEEFYEQNRDSYALPERRTVERILFPDEATAREAWLALEEGADFFAVGKQFANVAPEAIQLGEVMRDNYADEALAEQVYKQGLMASSEPFEGLFGWMISRVTEIKPAEEPALEEISKTLEAELRRERALDMVFDYVNRIEDQIAGGANAQEIAQDIDFALSDIAVSMTETEAVDGVSELLRGQIRNLKEVGEVQLVEDSLGGYRLIGLQEIQPSFVPEFDDIIEDVRLRWVENQRYLLALKQAKVLADRVNSGESIANIARTAKLLLRKTQAVNRDGVPYATEDPDNLAMILPEPKHLSALFVLAPNVAVALPSEQGARVMVLGEEIVDERESDNPELRTALANLSYFGFVETLREKYPIETHRVALDYLYDVLNGNVQQ